MWKKCPFSLRHWDSNPQPLEHESSPTTTRTGLLQLLRNAEICLVRIGRQFGRPRLQNSCYEGVNFLNEKLKKIFLNLRSTFATWCHDYLPIENKTPNRTKFFWQKIWRKLLFICFTVCLAPSFCLYVCQCVCFSLSLNFIL